MINPEDPAFPNKDHMGDGPEGLTKREYFAAMAMNGLLSGLSSRNEQREEMADAITRAIPGSALWMADALISELNKGKS